MANDLYPGATEPVWYGDRKVYSVTGLIAGARSRLVDLPAFWVEGEVSDFKHLGHLPMVYFTLKDPENGYPLSCVMFRGRFEALGVPVENGDKVQVYGRADIYLKGGRFQLTVQSIEHTGRGAIMQQLEALKERLASEGLFDESRKRPLPALPRRVGVITGSDAAAQGDFLRNVSERFPPVKLVIVETLVQGDRAAPQLVAALRKLERIDDVDVVVITRGGGAWEHFLPFSDERLCRAIAACRVPVISAIGHEKDNPLSDYVADRRESTPTAAARTVVPDYRQLVDGLDRALVAIRRRGEERQRVRTDVVASLRGRLSARSPARVVDDRRALVAGLRSRAFARARGRVEQQTLRLATSRRALASIDARVAMARGGLVRDRRDLVRVFAARLEDARARSGVAVGKLRALSPQGTLDRGYAIVRRVRDLAIVRDPAGVAVGEAVTMTVARATIGATVDEVEARG